MDGSRPAALADRGPHRLAAAAVCVALAVAGCGSSSLSATQLRQRAAQACTTANHLTADIPTPRAPAASAAFLKRGLAVLKPELAELRALKAPGDLGQVYTVSVDVLEDKLDALASTVHRLQDGDDPRAAITQLARRLAPLDSKEDAAWRTLRIPACVRQ